jgi:hypothetical protein
MAPRRPVLLEGQYALALVTLLVAGGSIALALWAFFG